MNLTALVGPKLVLPDLILEDHALMIENGCILTSVPVSNIPPSTRREELGRGWLLPGFIDTQVNGGGDVLLNDQPNLEGISRLLNAHRGYGTTAMLPTLISDTPSVMRKTIAAVEDGLRAHLPGLLGVHLEGPHINAEKRGIHDASRLTALTPEMVDMLAAPSAGVRMVTLAPELCKFDQIKQLAARGVIVSAGHSNASYEETQNALRAGVRGFTHLFNAMTQLGSREPGMVGAALASSASWVGLIVDGVHVHPVSLQVALAVMGPKRAMLVTDAMPPVGGARSSFALPGAEIAVVKGVCRGPNYTLAGSMLSMAQAFRNAIKMLGLSINAASQMASGSPAAFLRLDGTTGRIAPGLRADLVQLDDKLRVVRTWVAGELHDRGE